MGVHGSIGDHLRHWRQRRRMSQLDCALEANVSQRHLSFIESGRARPTREMVLQIARSLDVPLRERNALLLAAGHAPAYPARTLDDPALAAARQAVERLLAAHAPFPALAVDRHWTLLAANAPLFALVGTVPDAALLAPPVNVLRLSLHPGGLAPRIRNLAVWRGHLLARLRADAGRSGDPALAALHDELAALPGGRDEAPEAAILVPLEIEAGGRVLRLVSTTTVFGTPQDVTLSELALESFFPADDPTAAALRALHEQPPA
jgi:transcriptional regulator with XRE-family HTH domain